MKVYRIAQVDPTAREGEPGHPLHLLRRWQGAGRFDNPALYAVRYFAQSRAGAVAEVYGNLSEWTTAMLDHPTRGRAHLVTVALDEQVSASLVDLDDAAVLLERGLRPTDVVGRARTRTRTLAADLFSEGHPGIRFWSYHRSEWVNVALFDPPVAPADLTVVDVEPMSLDLPCVAAASEMLCRPIRG